MAKDAITLQGETALRVMRMALGHLLLANRNADVLQLDQSDDAMAQALYDQLSQPSPLAPAAPPAPAAAAATVPVRVLVAVDGNGDWVSAGYSADQSGPRDWIMVDDLVDPYCFHWLHAHVPLPRETSIAATVERNGEP